MTREEFKERLTDRYLADRDDRISWEEMSAQAAEEAGVVWDGESDQDRRFVQVTTSAETAEILREFNRRREEVEGAGWRAGLTVAIPEAFRRAIEADKAVKEAGSGVTDWYRGRGAGVQGPEPKRLTERRLRELAADAGLRAAEMGQAAQALGYEIVPDEVELPARIRIVVAGATDGETGRFLTDRERRAAEAWWEQRPTLVIIAQALASLTVAEGAEGRMALIQEDLDKALAAPARAARGEGVKVPAGQLCEAGVDVLYGDGRRPTAPRVERCTRPATRVHFGAGGMVSYLCEECGEAIEARKEGT